MRKYRKQVENLRAGKGMDRDSIHAQHLTGMRDFAGLAGEKMARTSPSAGEAGLLSESSRHRVAEWY